MKMAEEPVAVVTAEAPADTSEDQTENDESTETTLEPACKSP